jgi:hypothetical protein
MWLYIPPIILVAALVALVVILGKKNATLRKSGALRAESSFPKPTGSGKEKLKRIGIGSLNLLEKILHFIKVVFRKSEEAVTNWIRRVKQRKSGGKIKDGGLPGEGRHSASANLYEVGGSRIGEAEKEEIFSSVSEADENLEFTTRRSQVRSTPKEEITIIPAKTEPKVQPEDKIREDALIHRIAENPKDVEAYRELGDYYMTVGNIKDAKDSFKIVLKLRPRDLKAKSSLREIELRMRLGD